MAQPDEHLLGGLFFDANRFRRHHGSSVLHIGAGFRHHPCFQRIFSVFRRPEFATHGDKPAQVENFFEIVRHIIKIQMQCVELPDAKPFIKCISADLQVNPSRFAQTEKCLRFLLRRH